MRTTVLVRNKWPWRGIDDLEIAVTEYIDWFNMRRLHGEIGMIPPAEAETNYCSQQPEVTGRSESSLNPARNRGNNLHF